MSDSESLKKPLGITLGDPSGIGPEIILKALWKRRRSGPSETIRIYGSPSVLKEEDRYLQEVLPDYESPLKEGAVEVVDVVPEYHWEKRCSGEGDHRGAELQLRALKRAMEAAREEEIAAIVTAPWNKELFSKIDHPVVGHTEVLAEFFETPEVVMMLGGDALKVALVTTHIALGEVAERLSEEKIYGTTAVTIRGLKDSLGIDAPRVAVAGLNPHAGEGGHMGSEEIEMIVPALERLQRDFPEAEFVGPLPADTLFAKYRGGKRPFDVVICMYHDQGLIPLKLMHFGSSANVTLGLPVVRTSVDHGTAYDIAGKGIADEGSLLYALGLAEQMAGLRGESP